MEGLSSYWRSRQSSYLPLEIAIALRQQQQLLENLEVEATVKLAEAPNAKLSDYTSRNTNRAIALATDLFALGAPLPSGMVDVMTGATLRQVGRILFEPRNKRGMHGVLKTIDSVLDGPRVRKKLREHRRGKFMMAYIQRLDQFTSSDSFRESMAEDFRENPGLTPLLYCWEANVPPKDIANDDFPEDLINRAYDRISFGVKEYSRRRASVKVVQETKIALEGLGFPESRWQNRPSNSTSNSSNTSTVPNPSSSSDDGGNSNTLPGTERDAMQSFMHREHRGEGTGLRESTLDPKAASEVAELLEYKAEQFESDVIPEHYTVLKYVPTADANLYERYRREVAPWITALKSKVGAISQEAEKSKFQLSGRIDRRRAAELATMNRRDIFTRWEFEKVHKNSVVILAVDLSASVRQADVLPQAVLIWESLRDVGVVKVYGYQTGLGSNSVLLWDMSPNRSGILHLGGIGNNSQTVPTVAFEAAKQQFELHSRFKDRVLIHLTDGHPNVLTDHVGPLLEELREMGVREKHFGVGGGYTPEGMERWFGSEFRDVREPSLVPSALLEFFEVG